MVAISGSTFCVPIAKGAGSGTRYPIPVRKVRYSPLTFRRGSVTYAKFAPDGRTIVYAANWEGGPLERDRAYHNGPVWPWLAGPFIEAWLRVFVDGRGRRP